ncbi:MAG: sulfite exporter TauE/SafE family protein [Algibacter sp.]|uniref:urease accessory protein UreH domain-containing protein n=1 Tax=Algibacter sp. TaxID=1872428 RepID=UPI00262AFF1B|nr:sulfite exporter TauE/SafE family protein [Algibacter sp.]MDG1729172.1 sulfite exporter TauE/SafE family protein [Algibacter sp.]MDG2178429.1 sulfite exporter TauE/SafE family protein [Algibacter sp.]
MGISFPFIAALMASILHVITGPDHLAAVIPFAIESKKSAWKIGLFWGIGHLLGMVLIGVLFLIFREVIPVEEISNYSEQLVGLVLIFIGVWSFYKLFSQERTHKHLHVHNENSPIIHKHKHDHSHESSHHHKHPKDLKQSNLASLSIGFLHGLAGIAHFLLFIPVASFASQIDSVLYIFGFSLGIIIAMTTFTLVIGKISSYSRNEHNDALFKGIRLSGGLFAIIIGIYWMFST